jgi:hypothetical protein
MVGHIISLEEDTADLDSAPRVVLTVRLYSRAHEILVEEFASLGRRRRAARAAQLMLVGLLCERANLRPGVSMTASAPPAPERAVSHRDYGLAPEADAFLSRILRCSGTPQTDDDRGGGVAP